MSEKRIGEPVFAHIHVPKCAGSSVRRLLDTAWGDSHVHLYVPGPTTFIYDEAQLATHLQPSSVKAFSSHFVRRFLPEVGGRPMLYATFLRNPLEQWISYLTYTRKVYDRIPDPVLLQHLPPDMPGRSLRDCAQWLLSRNTETFTNFRENYVTNFFARYEVAAQHGFDYADPRYRRMRLRVARQALRRFFFVGITEDLEASLWLLRRKLAGTGLDIPALPVPAENSSHEQRDDLSWLSTKDPVGRQCLASLREDRQLYRWARTRWQRELTAEREGHGLSGWRGSLTRLGSGYYSTVTLLARLRGWSTSQPRRTAM